MGRRVSKAEERGGAPSGGVGPKKPELLGPCGARIRNAKVARRRKVGHPSQHPSIPPRPFPPARPLETRPSRSFTQSTNVYLACSFPSAEELAMGSTRGTRHPKPRRFLLTRPCLLPGPHHTPGTHKAQFWSLLLRTSLLLDSASRRPLPQGGFLGPGQARILVRFTSLISSRCSPGRDTGRAGVPQLPFFNSCLL